MIIMSQPITLSDELVSDAQRIGQIAARSIEGQIEFWAHLGRAIEPLLDEASVLALRRAHAVKPLSECLAAVDSDQGRQRVRAYLDSQPFPHYEAVPEAPDLLIRTDADGTRTVGRFVGRTFQPAE